MIVQFLDTIGDHPGRRMLGLKVVGEPGLDLEEQGIRKKLQHAGCHHPAPDTGQHHLIETGRQTPHFVCSTLAKDRRRWADTARYRKPLQIAHENTRWNRIAPSASIQDTPPAGAASRRRNRDGRQLAQLRVACPIRPARDIPGRRNRRPLRPATYPCGKLTTGTGQNTATMVQDRAPLTQKGPASHRAGFLIRLRQEAYFAFGNLVDA